MALSLVGTASGTGTGASFTVSLSGISIAAGDIVVVSAAFAGTTNSAPTCTGNNSGAYTGAGAAAYANDTYDTNFRLFYAVQGATPDSSLTITRVSSASYGGGAVVQVWRGVDTTTPLDATGTPATTTNGSRGNPPAVTPVTTGAVVISAGAGTQGASGSAFTVPSGMSNPVSINADGTTSDIGVWIASAAWTSGSYDPAAWTGGVTSTSCSAAAQTIALRPAATSGGGGGGSGSTVTWNPSDMSTGITLSNGNLTATFPASTVGGIDNSVVANGGVSSGKIYIEITLNTYFKGNAGFCSASWTPSSSNFSTGGSGGAVGWGWTSGNVYVNGTTAATLTSPAPVSGDVMMMALDRDNQLIWFGKNGTWYNGNPSAGTGGIAVSGVTDFLPVVGQSGTGADVYTANFGGSSFTYTPPTGFSGMGSGPTVYMGAALWTNRYLGARTDAQLYKGTRTLHS